jgi:hypothetical protein
MQFNRLSEAVCTDGVFALSMLVQREGLLHAPMVGSTPRHQ